jgi:outer membrane protein TolC
MSVQPSRHPRLIATLLALSLGGALAGGAAAADATAPSLTLDQALDLAAARNETADQAQARIDRAEGLLKEAYTLLRPSLTASGHYTLDSYKPGIWTPRPMRTAGAEADLDFTFFNIAALPAIKAAKKNIYLQNLQGSEQRRGLSFAVASAYIQVIAAEHQRDAAVKRRDVAKHSLDDEQARADAGLRSANDATRARLELAQADTTVTAAEQAAVDARLALGNLIALPADGVLADPPAAVAPSGDAHALAAAAIITRQDLAAQAAQVDIDVLRAKELNQEFWPTLGLRGSFATQDQLGADTPLDVPRDWRLSLTATWSLYDGGLRDAQASEYLADARGDSATLRAAKRQLSHDLAQALEAVRSADASIVQTRIEVTVAQTNANENHARVVQGLGTALEEADANAALFQAEVDLAKAQLDGQSSRFALRQVIGLWPLADREPPQPARVQPGDEAELPAAPGVPATAPVAMTQVVEPAAGATAPAAATVAAPAK